MRMHIKVPYISSSFLTRNHEITRSKNVFKLDLECGKRFTLDEKELNYLKNQETRTALIFNGATSEEYIIKTLDIDVKS